MSTQTVNQLEASTASTAKTLAIAGGAIACFSGAALGAVIAGNALTKDVKTQSSGLLQSTRTLDPVSNTYAFDLAIKGSSKAEELISPVQIRTKDNSQTYERVSAVFTRDNDTVTTLYRRGADAYNVDLNKGYEGKRRHERRRLSFQTWGCHTPHPQEEWDEDTVELITSLGELIPVVGIGFAALGFANKPSWSNAADIPLAFGGLLGKGAKYAVYGGSGLVNIVEGAFASDDAGDVSKSGVGAASDGLKAALEYNDGADFGGPGKLGRVMDIADKIMGVFNALDDYVDKLKEDKEKERDNQRDMDDMDDDGYGGDGSSGGSGDGDSPSSPDESCSRRRR
jgi:hypothetical protein